MPQEPSDEERLEELPDDEGTPFGPPTEASRDPDAAPDDERQDAETLDDTHPATDSNIELEEVYERGIAGAAGASEPNAGDAVVSYRKPVSEDKPSHGAQDEEAGSGDGR